MLSRLDELELDRSLPGFYDQPAFLAAERTQPRLLEAYAEHVEALPLSDGYLSYARERVQATVTFLQAELAADGRNGACVDVSAAVSRFLERQGVWNYIVSGAVTIKFPAGSTVQDKHFWPIVAGPTNGEAVAAHMWVRVPPYQVVDVTLAMQPYAGREASFLPPVVLGEFGRADEVFLSDLVDPEGVAVLGDHLGRKPVLHDVLQLNAGILERIERLGAWEGSHGDTLLRYVSCAVSAPDGPMETARNLCLRGKYMTDLWDEFVSLGDVRTGPRT